MKEYYICNGCSDSCILIVKDSSPEPVACPYTFDDFKWKKMINKKFLKNS